MRISFVSPYADLSGGSRVVAIYADRLQRRGHQVCVVSLPRRSPTLRNRIRELLREMRFVHRSRGPSHFDLIPVDHRVLDRHRPVEERDLPDADVVVATWWETAEWVARLSPRKGAKAYFIQGHEAAFEYLPRERVAATYALPLHKITLSRWLGELMETRYRDPCVSVVLNSVDTEQFHAPPRDKQSIPTFGALYSRNYLKGWGTVLAAYEAASRRVPGLRLVAFGHDGPSPESPLPPGARYYRQPPQDEIRNVYAQCDVWVCGSLLEGFHLPPLEAMACRCPVVSTAVGGPIDRIQEGVNGFLVPVGDSAALGARAADVLLMPGPAWRAMSDGAYATATSYSWDDAAAAFERALQLAVKRGDRAG